MVSIDPLVSIGLPVFNGAQFLAQAIESLLNQTYKNIELIVSDNASTDATPEICKRYESSDSRLSYSRLLENIGGVPNANRVFSLASGKYFMWAAHDDLWKPTYVERCVHWLEIDPGTVLVCSEMGIIDEAGKVQRLMETPHTAESPRAAERLREFIQIHSITDACYGVTRADVLRKTRLLPLHPGNDKLLLAELALHGRIVHVPEHLYMRRDHGHRSVKVYPKIRDRYVWVDPTYAGKRMFPHWAYLRGYLGAVLKVPLSIRARVDCGIVLLKWIRYHWKELADDLKL